MALIKCDECGKEISDKAESCPNCGCPVKIKNNGNIFNYNGLNYDISKVYFLANQNRKVDAIKAFREITNVSLIEAKDTVENIIRKGKVQTNYQIKCPRCGSSDFDMVKKNWSLLTGFMTNKVDRVCRNCKNKF